LVQLGKLVNDKRPLNSSTKAMYEKNVTFLATTHRGGTHLLREIFVRFGFKEVARNPLVFWPLYLRAVAHPLEDCPFGWSPNKEKMTNEKCLKALYSSWGYDPDSPDWLAEETAKKVFGEIISNRIEDSNLLISNMFEYNQPSPEGDDGSVWTQSDSDQAFRLLSESLRATGVSAKYLAVIRHPLSLYMSTQERSPKKSEQQWRINQIAGFYRRVEDIQADDSLNHYLLRYEDLCNKPRHIIEELIHWTFPDIAKAQSEALLAKAHRLPRRASKKNLWLNLKPVFPNYAR